MKFVRNINFAALAALWAATCTFLSSPVNAQIPVPVVVSGTEPASTCISLSKGSTDTDIILKFSFNEQDNTLSVSLVSYRELFVFHDNVRYSRIFSCGKMKPGKLPYEVTVPEKGRFRSTSSFRRSIRLASGRNSRSYVFSRWFDYEGMKPVPGECRMLNDSIVQTFDIQGKRTSVKVSLNDIAILDPCRKEGHYRFVMDKNVGKAFDITIVRNPCFGKDEEIRASENALAAVTAAYDSLKVIYGNGVAPTDEAFLIFNNIKALVTKQFQKTNADSECECLLINRERYNSCIDSIAALNYKSPAKAIEQQAPKGINVERMLLRVHRIDTAVNKWLNSTDPVERRDLEKRCEMLIEESDNDVKANGLINAEQQEAWNMLKKAEKYYRNTTLRK